MTVIRAKSLPTGITKRAAYEFLLDISVNRVQRGQPLHGGLAHTRQGGRVG